MCTGSKRQRNRRRRQQRRQEKAKASSPSPKAANRRGLDVAERTPEEKEYEILIQYVLADKMDAKRLRNKAPLVTQKLLTGEIQAEELVDKLSAVFVERYHLAHDSTISCEQYALEVFRIHVLAAAEGICFGLDTLKITCWECGHQCEETVHTCTGCKTAKYCGKFHCLLLHDRA